MALDPRISLAVQAPNVTPAINLFNQAMQQKRANDLMPGQLDLQQQQIQARQQANQAGALDLKNAKDAADLKSVAGFSALNAGAMDAALGGDASQLSSALQGRIAKLEAEGRDATQSREALEMIKAGNVKGAISSFKAAEKLAERSGLLSPINAGLGTNKTDAQRREERINIALEGAKDENGRLKPRDQLTAEQERAAIDAKLLPPRREYKKEKMSSATENELIRSQNEAISAGNNAERYLILADEIEQADIGGGIFQGSWSESLKELTGNQDAVSALRKRYAGIKASEVVANLPPGAASDKDIELALEQFPSKNATGQQISQFLRGLSKLEKFQAEYNKFKSSYISENGNTKGLLGAWDSKSKENEQESTLTTNPEAQMEQPTNSGFKILSIE
ncbi:MAG: hypothetical protein K0U20_08360 [Proteobacteria bacterium]|nr:hypothetical protein [Pseudomonadota bacterium]